MRSTRTPIRGIFSHSITAVGTTWTLATLAILLGNQMVVNGATNTIIVPRDGWYNVFMDTQYQNSAGSQFLSYLTLNGNNVITLVGMQNVTAGAPTTGYSRVMWLKAGDRLQINSYHNEGGSTRQVNGVVTFEEIVL